MNFKFKEKYCTDDLLKILDILRSEDGCPWDREQTHESIRSNFIEETYETIEAIDLGDNDLLKEELGDVLLQIVFHSKIEAELGHFDFSDVVDGICKKLIFRHPHVFSDLKLESSEEVLENWDKLKMKTKSQNKVSEAIDGISASLPSLIKCEKIQQKSSKVKLDLEDINRAMRELYREFTLLSENILGSSCDNCFSKIGYILFSIVNISRLMKIDPDYALSEACKRFVEKFKKFENLLESKTSELTSTELSEIWDRL